MKLSVQAETAVDLGLSLERQSDGYCCLMASLKCNTAAQSKEPLEK